MQTRARAQRSLLSSIGFVISLSAALAFALFPLLWIALTSLKSNRDILEMPPLFVFQPTLEHWQSVWQAYGFLRFYGNSLIIGTCTAIVVLVVGTLAAYSLARSKSKVRENLAFFILSQRMMPPVAVVLPIYIMLSEIKALDRLETLIMMNVAFNLPLAIWIIRGFIESLQIELEEAAVVDGATWFGAFVRVGLPQIVPGLLSSALLVFIYTMNEFFFALILSGTKARPISVAVQNYLPTGVRGTMFGEAAVASILIMLPCLLFAIIMQRHLVSGISLGALKG